MGLSAPKKRTKLSHDPNNNYWSRSTKNYGHKMLRSQGWTPGQTLGVVDSPHARFHTKASSSHIRTLLREENLGLGAQIGSGQAAGECIGLDAFQNILGRLNGKSNEALEKEQKSRDDFKRSQYLEQKIGGRRWVKGGYLVGDEIRDAEAAEVESLVPSMRAQSISGDQEEAKPTTEKVPKKKRKAKRDCEESETKHEDVDSAPQASEEVESQLDVPLRDDEEARRQRKAARREEKAKRKAGKAQRRLERQQRNESKVTTSDGQDPTGTPSTENDTEVITTAPSTETSQPPTPGGFVMGGGRHAVRRRYIQHKKMAMMDPKSLNEILMVKALRNTGS